MENFSKNTLMENKREPKKKLNSREGADLTPW